MTESFAIEGKTFDPFVHPGEDPVVPLFEYGDSMTKVASSLDHVPRLQDYINKASGEDGWYTTLIHANGIDEVWGGNRKGDSFPKKWLVPQEKNAQYGYQTFEKKALGYVHHRNTPDRWTGRVLMAEYSEPMGRVELIVKYNIQRLREEAAPYFAEMLERGELPAVSMGCRVPYDICSICGHQAPNTSLYCDHLRLQRKAILPDGRSVRMFNPFPIFHDISLVSSPADPAARVLLKIAEYGEESGEKSSEIDKKIPGSVVGGLRRLSKSQAEATLRTSGDPDIDFKNLMILARYSKHAALSALTSAGILLRPHEYAAMEYGRTGELRKAAEVYASRGQFPIYDSPVAQEFAWVRPDRDLVDLVSPMIQGRSIYVPAFEERAQKTAEALPESVVSVPDRIEVGYSRYRKTAEDALLDGRAVETATHEPEILTQALRRDISLVMKLASLDAPRVVFEALVKGAHLPQSF